MADSAATVPQGPWSDYSAPVTSVTDPGTASGPWSDYAPPSAGARAESAAEGVLGDFGVSPSAAKDIVGGAEDIGSAVGNMIPAVGNAIDYGLQRAAGKTPQEAASNPAMGYLSPGAAGKAVEAKVGALPGLATGRQLPDGTYATVPSTLGQDWETAKESLGSALGRFNAAHPNVAYYEPDIQNAVNMATMRGALHFVPGVGEGAAETAAAEIPHEAPPAVTGRPVSPEDVLSDQPIGATPAMAAQETAATPSSAPTATSTPPASAAPRVPVPGKPHITPKVPPEASAAPPEPAPTAKPAASPQPAAQLFKAPGNENARIIERTPEEQHQLVNDMHTVGIPEAPASVLNGDRLEMANDMRTARASETRAGKRMSTMLGNARQAIRGYFSNLSDQLGGGVIGDSQTAEEEAGQHLTAPISAFEQHLDNHIQSLYQGAKAAQAGRPPAPMPALQAALGQNSMFVGTTEGTHLLAGIRARMGELGVQTAPDGSIIATPEQAERLRQYVTQNYNYKSATASSLVKNALDEDVTRTLGEQPFKAGRQIRAIKGSMLEEQPVTAKLMDPEDRAGIDRTVQLDKVSAHLMKQPPAQLGHYLTTLRTAAKMYPDIAPVSARAINELRTRYLQRIVKVGDSTVGLWNAKAVGNFLRANDANLKLLFNPKELDQIRAGHDVGHAFNMPNSYEGAAAQALNFAARHAEKAAAGVNALAGAAGAKLAGPVGAAAADMAAGPIIRGTKGLIERTLGKASAEKRLLNIDELRGKLNQRPLGQRFPKQGGWIGDLRKSKLPEVKHRFDPANREHTVISKNGYTTAQQRGNDIQITATRTEPTESGKGEGVARVARLADEAHARGGVLQSDTNISKDGQKVYPALSHLGYDVRKNPDVDLRADGKLLSNNGQPVFTVGPPKRPPLRQNYDPAAGIYDAQVKRDVEAAHANPNRVRPPLVQEGHVVGGPRGLAGKFPGQRGGPKFERQAETGKGAPAEYKASPALNAFIRSRAPAHVVDPNGPATWDELKARGAESPLPVNPQEAEGSIYKDTPTNIAFRAWHDSLHLKHDAGFDHEGEMRTALAHQEEAKAAGLSPHDRAALWADTWNTFEHHEKTGEFPKNPRQFVAQKLAEDKPQAQLNIGLHVGNPDEGGHFVEPDEAVKQIKNLGYKVGKTSIVQSDTEPTLVADIHGAPMVKSDLHELSRRLEQGAIAQRLNDGSGMLEGPQAKDWGGAYNPDYFRTHEGNTAAQTDRQTVTNPQRMAYPGIYDKPADVLSRVKVAPEDPILQQLFGVTRKDLHDAAVNRTSNMRYDLPGAAKKPQGSKAANGVMNDKNAQRLVDLINEAKKNPELYHGMAGWYVMDPLFKKVVDTIGRKAAPATYSRLNAFMGMASPGSDVNSEINRGTAANMMAAQGKFDKFAKYGGRPAGARGKPAELAAVTGHPYHGTAQVPAMRRFLESGTVEGKTPKVPTYIAASGVPETGFQNHMLVGDSHWSRGVGLSDTRTGETKVHGSVQNSEIQQLHPWYKEKVAKATGLPPTSAQAVQWGALSHETGVETPVGAPKLELFAQQVRKAAARLKITPEEALKRIILGTAHAG